MRLVSASEFGLIAVPLTRMEVKEGRYVLAPDALHDIEQGRAKLQEVLAERLARSPRKDVYIFVHGFNNTFNDAVFRLAMAWHMAGRPGVPIAYTWPAGHGGLAGYAYDRESGEFTVSHLRRFLKAVAACPQVERIHLIAHSRGTDVAIAALRELNIETRAKDLRTKEVYKLDDVVLAAPDVDAEVFEQRFAIEDLHLAANRTTVYLSRTDFALGLSRWLFGGGSRVGNLRPEDLTPESRRKLAQLKGFCLINCNVSGFSGSHDYAFVHPAVVSDLILLLRDGDAPGDANGRPLKAPFDGVWEVNNDYLKPVRAAPQRR
jgi:esterase/lipase superfamily enzyme